MTFFVTSENRVTRVDGMKDLNERLSSGTSVRGVAGGVLNRFFNQQFYRDIVEMGLLPRDPIKVTDKWTTSRQVNGGLWGNNMAQLDLNYEFRGWQRRDGTNCIRLDFTGTLKPPGSASTQPGARRPAVRPSSSLEEGKVSGQCWYNPELALAIDTVYELSLSSRSTSIRRTTSRPASGGPGTPGGTNRVVMLEAEGDELESSGPPPPPSGSTPPPPRLKMPPGAPTNFAGDVTVTTTTNTTSSSSQWHTNVRLLEVEPLQ